MKALSVRQPYAELIACGAKPLEVRSWRTSYRGPLLIVASSSAWREDIKKFGLTTSDCPRGVAVCVVDLVDIFQARDQAHRSHSALASDACCEFDADDYLWRLSRPRRIAQSIAIAGRLRLFDPYVGAFDDDEVRRWREAFGDVPPCAAQMGCLCAGHARGNAASAACDISEGLAS